MRDRSAIHRLQDRASQCRAAVVYDPQNDEVDFSGSSFPLRLPPTRIMLPPDKNADPFAWSSKCAVEFAGFDVCLLIPGKRFDPAGTRHGRGGGWYDRFLSNIPASWLRIGIAPRSNISRSFLEREAWDEPVDWVLAQDDLRWIAYETMARNRPPPNLRITEKRW